MKTIMKRFGAAALAGVCASATMTDAWAQRRKGEPKTEAPAAAAAPQGAPQGPQKIELQPSQANWTKVCGKDQGSGREVCYTTRDFGQGADQPPVLALAVYDVKGVEKRILRMLLPVALLLRPGFRFSIDQGPPGAGAFAVCFPNGCFAEAEVTPSILASMKKGTTLNVSVRNQAGGQVDFSMALAGFGKAFDGPPIDPKILQAQQKEIQKQLEERAKREREKLEKSKGGEQAPKP
jgi:invasion protein IalB